MGHWVGYAYDDARIVDSALYAVRMLHCWPTSTPILSCCHLPHHLFCCVHDLPPHQRCDLQLGNSGNNEDVNCNGEGCNSEDGQYPRRDRNVPPHAGAPSPCKRLGHS
eukprot:gene8305-biopygen15155